MALAKRVLVRVTGGLRPDTLRSIKETVMNCRGPCSLCFEVETDEALVNIDAGKDYMVLPARELLQRLCEILGPKGRASVKSKEKFTDIDKALKELQDTISRLKGIDTAEIERKVDVFRKELYEGISRWGVWSCPVTPSGLASTSSSGGSSPVSPNSGGTASMRTTPRSSEVRPFSMMFPSW